MEFLYQEGFGASTLPKDLEVKGILNKLGSSLWSSEETEIPAEAARSSFSSALTEAARALGPWEPGSDSGRARELPPTCPVQDAVACVD